jgi:hypothetical protein
LISREELLLELNKMISSSNGGGSANGNSLGVQFKKEPNQRNSYRQHRDSRKPSAKQLKFTGRCKALDGHIFDCSDAQQANVFTKTLKEVAEYGGHACKSTALICRSIESLGLVMTN